MSDGGLCRWDALAISRQAFVHAFLPAAERDALRRAVEQDVFGVLSGGETIADPLDEMA